jgi:hypothetical protein
MYRTNFFDWGKEGEIVTCLTRILITIMTSNYVCIYKEVLGNITAWLIEQATDDVSDDGGDSDGADGGGADDDCT